MEGQVFGTYYSFTTTQIVVAAIVLVLVVGLAIYTYVALRRRRTLAFRNRFGTEYDRAVLTHGSPRSAESKLADRETRVKALRFVNWAPPSANALWPSGRRCSRALSIIPRPRSPRPMTW